MRLLQLEAVTTCLTKRLLTYCVLAKKRLSILKMARYRRQRLIGPFERLMAKNLITKAVKKEAR